jgi:hypothetical protein
VKLYSSIRVLYDGIIKTRFREAFPMQMKEIFAAITVFAASSLPVHAEKPLQLTDEQAFAVEIQRNFNQCVKAGVKSKEYVQQMQAYETAYSDAAIEAQRRADEYQRLDKAWHDLADPYAKDNGFEERLSTAKTEEELERIQRNQLKQLEALFGKHPEEPEPVEMQTSRPEHPNVFCKQQALAEIKEKGLELNTVYSHMQGLYEYLGPAEYERITTPDTFKP